MNNKRLIVAILLLALAGVVALAGFTKLALWSSSPQVIIYPAGTLALVGIVQLWIYWRRKHSAR